MKKQGDREVEFGSDTGEDTLEYKAAVYNHKVMLQFKFVKFIVLVIITLLFIGYFRNTLDVNSIVYLFFILFLSFYWFVNVEFKSLNTRVDIHREEILKIERRLTDFSKGRSPWS